MPLEDMTGTDKFIDAFNNSWPLGSDSPTEGDDHLRGIKNVLKNWGGTYADDALSTLIPAVITAQINTETPPIVEGIVPSSTATNLRLRTDNPAEDALFQMGFYSAPAGLSTVTYPIPFISNPYLWVYAAGSTSANTAYVAGHDSGTNTPTDFQMRVKRINNSGVTEVALGVFWYAVGTSASLSALAAAGAPAPPPGQPAPTSMGSEPT